MSSKYFLEGILLFAVGLVGAFGNVVNSFTHSVIEIILQTHFPEARGPGVDVLMTIFVDFRRKKLAFFF
jgi:large-conductance mechanosensitive channel